MSEFPDKNGLEAVAAHFIDLFRWNIRRPGAEKLLEYLKTETDFFTAPAGAKHHGAFPGGLLVHSVNVYNRLREIAVRELAELYSNDLEQDVEETVTILDLLHDVCKAGVYHEEIRNRKNPETGVWEKYRGYTYKDPFPLGHGEKSLYLIARYMELTEAEALAIRWHMGAYDMAARADLRDLSAAMDATPWVLWLHEADMSASHIDERSADA